MIAPAVTWTPHSGALYSFSKMVINTKRSGRWVFDVPLVLHSLQNTFNVLLTASRDFSRSSDIMEDIHKDDTGSQLCINEGLLIAKTHNYRTRFVVWPRSNTQRVVAKAFPCHKESLRDARLHRHICVITHGS